MSYKKNKNKAYVMQDSFVVKVAIFILSYGVLPSESGLRNSSFP